MYPYMISNSDVGGYWVAFEYSLNAFRMREPENMAETSGCRYDAQRGAFSLASLGQPLSVSFPEGEVLFQGTDIMPVWRWRLLALNYLWRSDGFPLTGQRVSFRQLKHGQVFYSAFQKLNITQLANDLAGIDIDKARNTCLALDGKMETGAWLQASFSLLPRFPVTIQFWPGDEEVAGGANILFDASAIHYLHIEDVVAAGDIVARFFTLHSAMPIGCPE